MAQPEIFVTDSPEAADVAVITSGLDEFNEQRAGVNDRRDLAVLLRDPDTGCVVGGLTGRTSLGLLFIDLLHLPAGMREQGLGSKILRLAEDEGRRRGCRTAVVYTISFQAPGFYEKNGWRAFGDIGGDGGVSRIFLTKELS